MNDDDRSPSRLVVVAGTGTEVGKTWVTARLARDLRGAGLIAVRKPAQSFDAGDRSTDADVLAEATGAVPTDVCPHHRWYEVPMAPPMAADALGRPSFTVADLAAELEWEVPAPDIGPPPDIGMVESAGGVRSPLAADGDTITLVEALQPDIVVLVADAGLGTINSVRLSIEALDRGAHVASIVVFLNRYDPADDLHRRNHTWLGGRDRLETFTALRELSLRIGAGLVGSSGG